MACKMEHADQSQSRAGQGSRFGTLYRGWLNKCVCASVDICEPVTVATTLNAWYSQVKFSTMDEFSYVGIPLTFLMLSAYNLRAGAWRKRRTRLCKIVFLFFLRKPFFSMTNWYWRNSFELLETYSDSFPLVSPLWGTGPGFLDFVFSLIMTKYLVCWLLSNSWRPL